MLSVVLISIRFILLKRIKLSEDDLLKTFRQKKRMQNNTK